MSIRLTVIAVGGLEDLELTRSRRDCVLTIGDLGSEVMLRLEVALLSPTRHSTRYGWDGLAWNHWKVFGQPKHCGRDREEVSLHKNWKYAGSCQTVAVSHSENGSAGPFP